MTQLDHEKLEVYKTSIEFVALADKIVRRLRRGRSYLADQLQRAATSISLNIAEGAGEFSNGDKARFYRIAKRSATECAAILDVCRTLDVIDEKQLQDGHDKIVEIVSMLTRMVRNRSRSK